MCANIPKILVNFHMNTAKLAMNDSPCYCQSTVSYPQCCGAIHTGASVAPTAQALMRSRYSAFCTRDWAYLVQTGPQADDTEIKAWAADKQWLGLRIVRCEHGKPTDNTGKVEFVAFFKDSSQPGLQQHHEFSSFVRIDDRWRFIQGDFLPDVKLNRNEACPCGSGKKYKRCCLA